MVVSISAIKGGSGKSTTATAMAAGLRLKKKRVLLIDLDAQGNTTETVAGEIGDNDATVFEVLTGKASAQDAIRKAGGFGDIIPASPDLAAMDNVLTAVGKEHRLKESIAAVVGNYDYVIMDTPPSAGILLTNALTVADGVVIPTSAENYGMRGIAYLSEFIAPVRSYTNANLKVMGILLTRHNERKIISRDYAKVIAELAVTMGTRVYNTYIRECVAICEAQDSRQTIFEYAPDSNAAKDYSNFVNEFLTANKGEK